MISGEQILLGLICLVFIAVIILGIDLLRSGVRDVMYVPEPNTCMECGAITHNFALCGECQAITDRYYRERERNLPR